MHKRTKSNSIRIIAGEWRGRRVPVLDHQGLRPTTDRVRETLFNWLAPYIAGARCLDLFAGTGALGLESLSRGAGFVQFVEADSQVSVAIQDSLRVLTTNDVDCRYEVLNRQAEIIIGSKPTEPFDIVFLDPPFDSGLLTSSAELLEENHWLSDAALVYLEYNSKQAPALPTTWQVRREKVAGQCIYALYSPYKTG